MHSRNVKVGLAGLGQDSFKGDKEQELRRNADLLKAKEDILGFQLTTHGDIIKEKDEAKKARKRFEAENVDFMLVLNSSFAPGTLVEELSRGDYRLGLWSVAEKKNWDILPFNAFCGSNMNASTLAEVQGEDYKFKWFYGDVEGEFFLPRFKITLRALKALKTIEGGKIGLVVGPAPGFKNIEFKAEELKRVLGLEVDWIEDFSEIKSRAEAVSREKVKKEMARIENEAREVKVEEKFIKKTARYILALENLAGENNYAGLALRCWPDTNQEYGIFPCSAMGKLNERGLPASCEGDVYGVINMILLQEITGNVPSLMDLVDLDFKENRALFWHCGSGPADYARQGCYNEDYQFNNEDYGMVTDMQIKPMTATVLNMTNNGKHLLGFKGRFVDSVDEGYHGDRGWFTDFYHLEEGQFALRDLVETIYDQRLSHHFALAEGDCLREIAELKSWLQLARTDITEYKSWL